MNIFKRFWKSLYSPQDIACFRNDKLSKSITYIIILAFVAFLPLAYYTTVTARDTLRIGAETIQNEIPDFKIIDGKLKTTEEKNGKLPLAVDQDELHIYFDASGTLDTYSVDNKIADYDSAIAFLSDKVYLTAGGISQSVSYKALGITDKKDLVKVYQSIETMSQYFIPLILFFVFIIILAATFFRVALYALFGYIWTGLRRGSVTYRQNWMIASYSITLMTVFTMIMEWLQVIVPFNMEINLVVSLIFVFLAVKSIPQQNVEK